MGELTREEWLERKNAIDIKMQCHDDEIKRLNTRLIIVEDMTREIQKINTNIELMIQKMDMHHEELNEQGERINALEQVPKMRWNAVVQAIISVLIGSGMTLVIQNILVK